MRCLTVAGGVASLALAIYLAIGGVIGSEFLPHLDEGALWVRGTLAPSTGPTEGIRVANQARIVLCSFPEVTQCTSQVGRPDDGTDTTGFFNTEYFVDLKPKEQWRPAFHQNKEELIAAMNRELEKIPGVRLELLAAHRRQHGRSGQRRQRPAGHQGLWRRLEDCSRTRPMQIVEGHAAGPRDRGSGSLPRSGPAQRQLRGGSQQAARYQINVADVQDAIQTAVGGNALTQVLQGEARYDLVMRYLPQYRDTKEAIENIRLLSPTGERVSLAQLCKIEERDGASEIYREGNQRYIAIKYSVRGRDLGGAVEEAIKKVNAQVQLPRGYHIDWEGEYESEKRAEARLLIIVPLTVLLIFMILYTMFRSFKWAMLILVNVMLARIGGLAGAAAHAHQFQRVLGRRVSGAVRRLGADRRDHARVHQSAARARPHHRGCGRGRRGAEAAAHHDDDAGGDAGTAAGGAVARHRVGFAAAVRHRDRRRADLRPGDEHLSAADSVRMDGGRARRAA